MCSTWPSCPSIGSPAAFTRAEASAGAGQAIDEAAGLPSAEAAALVESPASLPPEPEPQAARVAAPARTAAPIAMRRFCMSGVSSCSAELDGALGQPHPETVDDAALTAELGLGGAERNEQRGEVLGTRMGKSPRGRGMFEVQQGVDVLGVQRLVPPVVELHRPTRRLLAPVPQRRQIVREEPAADDQDTLVTQRGQPPPDLEQLLRLQARH